MEKLTSDKSVILDIADKCMTLAKELHEGQFRKFGNPPRPYIYHIKKVEKKVHQWNGNVVVRCGAILHDTVEDCDITIDDLYKKLSLKILNNENDRHRLIDEITQLVSNLTKTPAFNKALCKDIPKQNRAIRWKRDLDRLNKSCSATKLIKLCDRICNLQEYLEFFEEIPLSEINFISCVYLTETRELNNTLWTKDNHILRQLCMELFDVTKELQYMCDIKL